MPKLPPGIRAQAGPDSLRSPRARGGSADSPGTPGFPVIGIGASAGGLEAFQKFFDAVPAHCGMAFILIQHLDPNHPSLMVDLLATHTRMAVKQADDGMTIEQNTIYVIPPGTYLAVAHGALRLSKPRERHGARLPFDFLLHSLAEAYGERAICAILSGTGADGSSGALAIKEHGGLVVAQDPTEAAYDGMPRNAMLTGAVDLILPVARIPAALIRFNRRMALARQAASHAAANPADDWLGGIIDILRVNENQDFSLYKPGTLRRRIERRMAMAAIESDDMQHYLDVLRDSEDERSQLARDLLINVTSFFRDPGVFETLATRIVPAIIRNSSADRPIRVWVVGCSTGEEAYSLAILFREQMREQARDPKLQIFASDADPDAIAHAREGLYPETIEADVSQARLKKYFIKEENGYRVSAELRASVVFTVQNVLADPPISRVDLVSCRNLLIYLNPEAQTKVLSVFHFALREDGILLLGNAENIDSHSSHFEPVHRAERIFRRRGRKRQGELGFSMAGHDAQRGQFRAVGSPAPARQSVLGDLCQRLVIESYTPAAVLINQRQECLYSLGPTDRYLQVVPGHPTNNLLSMARDGVRSKLRSALHKAAESKARSMVPGGTVRRDGDVFHFAISAEPVATEGEDLVLVCFHTALPPPAPILVPDGPKDQSRVGQLEEELVATKSELCDAIQSLELSANAQKAVNDEALSVNEEYQAVNEELLASKEELQSLNEELTALNNQLHETLEQQNTTSNDLQNVLNSTDVATIFLDQNMVIRFFTPATRLLFSVLPGDIGRPLSDLNSTTGDAQIIADAHSVMATGTPLELEVLTPAGKWYVRRILPYKTDGAAVMGVVITFTDITERHQITEALQTAKAEAQAANTAKSSFLAAASHDLRQPLQTLALVHGLLAKLVTDKKALDLIYRLDDTLESMASMLNALLDINQIEAGIVVPEYSVFPLGDVFKKVSVDFAEQAKEKGLALRIVDSRTMVRSDARLLEQMVRNLLSNALKYTETGKVLLGCRHRADTMVIEVYDTGIGISEDEFGAIFVEYHQIGNDAREQSRGLGLGLSIVQRLAALLGHRVQVRSRTGHGSVFSITIDRLGAAGDRGMYAGPDAAPDRAAREGLRTGRILVVEDDAVLRNLLVDLLRNEGHRTISAATAAAACDAVVRDTARPDIILADFNLPGGVNGLDMAAKVRTLLHADIPVMILTGDISADTLRRIAAMGCTHLGKPVKATDVVRTVQELLAVSADRRQAAARPAAAPDATESGPVIHVVDDDPAICDSLKALLEQDGMQVQTYLSSEEFLHSFQPGQEGCILLDAYLPGMSGLELLQVLRAKGFGLPAIMITGHSDVAIAVTAMKAGAVDFIEKPINNEDLHAAIARALERSHDVTKRLQLRAAAKDSIRQLTPRQHQIMDMVLAGHPSKNIASDLGISQRTVENHRSSIMQKTGAKSLPALARLVLAASSPVEATAPAAD